MTSSFTILETENGLRLDKILASRYPSYSRTYFQYLIDAKSVLLNKKPFKKKDSGGTGDSIDVTFIPSPEISLKPQPIDFTVLFEDEHLIGINKPRGLVVHPGAGNPDQTLINGLIYYLKKIPEGGDPLRPGLVHRLDKETSGIIIAAKTSNCHALLVDMFKNREIEKHYLAICHGVPKQGTLITNIGRNPFRRQEMCVRDNGGKLAETKITTLAHNGKKALVLAQPKTGRTHQIRVHLKHLNAPIVGDKLYGPSKNTTTPLMLHARKIKFTHPITKEILEIKAPILEDFNTFIKTL